MSPCQRARDAAHWAMVLRPKFLTMTKLVPPGSKLKVVPPLTVEARAVAFRRLIAVPSAPGRPLGSRRPSRKVYVTVTAATDAATAAARRSC